MSIAFAVGKPDTLQKLVSGIKNPNIDFPNIILPEAFFADKKSFQMDKGNVVFRVCSFLCYVSISDFNQFNSLSALSCDVKLGDINVFMPLTRISAMPL